MIFDKDWTMDHGSWTGRDYGLEHGLMVLGSRNSTGDLAAANRLPKATLYSLGHRRALAVQ